MQQLPMSRARLRLTPKLLACCALVAAIVIHAAAQGTRMWLDPATLQMATGDESTVDIRVETAVELAGAEIHVGFDSELLEVVDADPSVDGVQIAHGDFLSADFVIQNDAAATAGRIDYAIACIPLDKAVSGEGVLARLTFRAVAEGEAQVTVDRVLLANARGESVEVETGSSLITISGPGQGVLRGVLIGVAGTTVVLGGCVVVGWRTLRARKLIRREIGMDAG